MRPRRRDTPSEQRSLKREQDAKTPSLMQMSVQVLGCWVIFESTILFRDTDSCYPDPASFDAANFCYQDPASFRARLGDCLFSLLYDPDFEGWDAISRGEGSGHRINEVQRL